MTPSNNPILLDIPEQFETERLMLRPFQVGDEAIFGEGVAESVAEMRPWIPFTNSVLDAAGCKAYVRSMMAAFLTRKRLVFQMFLKNSGEYLGNIGFYRIDWSVPRLEIGYWIRTGATGRGYATEAVNWLTDYGFRHLSAERIEIVINARNTASIPVPERCGFTLEVRLRSHEYDAADILSDMLIYSMIRSEWEARSG